ncbi:type III toxin-antitoxin system ToxN/AbiQ family toxin [Anaerorhabdus furcosa]|uniref:Toxin ToxN, type III toxin-antitoxin system n=1 Tax=Anaerorhabdus furcosa TaxID=118967 RepID=A0A1T4NP86_9FIRM|nr:type III toxin-antitoxin system ToxN/AbiQ family toxin [Anaerorhabdus furcosa]SJZ81130.1 Toxin ToxN, type III toxin-antitoxin system [Anaerorhabdus furcosa]
MHLYKADKNYIDYLSSKDSKVMDNKDPLIRPYWFFEIELDNHRFAVPLSSPKEASRTSFNQFSMIRVKENSEDFGRLYFINMIPFDERLFTSIDKLKQQYDRKYESLLYKQSNELMKQITTIQNRARNVFNARYDTKHKKHNMLVANSCNFKKCIEYMNEYLSKINEIK